MTDDMWRRREGRGEDSETGEFGGPLFPADPADDLADDHDDDDIADEADDTGGRRLSFGPDDTGPLPHWTAPPTGEIPRLAPPAANAGAGDDDEGDDVDVWSTFTTESPVWRDDEDPATVTGVMEQVPSEFGAGPGPDSSGSFDRSGGLERDSSGGLDRPTGQTPRSDATGDFGTDDFGTYRHEPSGEISTGLVRPYGRSAQRGADPSGSVPIPRREPGRITIGTDPSGTPRRSPDPGRRRSGPPPRGGGRPAGPARGVSAQTPRNMQSAVVAGVVLAGGFIAALVIHELIVLGIIVAVLAVAGFEYFGKVTEKGYRPAVVAGLVACVAAPIAAYNFGERALPLVIVLGFVVGAVGFMGAHGIEAGPLPNMAITTLGVVWIAILGSFAALILRLNTGGVLINGSYVFASGSNVGTDTLLLVALGVAANDIGALVVGSAVGKTPLRAWISPSKTIEGLLGGSLATIVALFIASKLMDDASWWTDTSDALILGLVIAVTAPLGDLTESMFKRNLDVKDFGSIVQGHGGVLDRFDGFLFALPAAYYATLYLVTN